MESREKQNDEEPLLKSFQPPGADARLTVDVLDHVDAEAVSGDGGEHLAGAPPPGQVVGGAPGGDGTEEQLEVIFLGQLLGRGHKRAQLHQDLREKEGR